MVNEVAQSIVCPGLFYNTPAQDAYLIRIRTPGGWLNQQQGRAIAELFTELATVAAWNKKTIQVTNRANLQVRSIHPPTPEIFQTLQDLGLAAQNRSVDHLRNLMTSPTAGIDSQELIDTRPLVLALDTYIRSHPELAGLPAKFSVGIDGGGAVGIGTRSPIPWEHRYNEIQLSAVLVHQANHSIDLPAGVYFRLALGSEKQLRNTSVLIKPDECVPVVGALAAVYLDYVNQNDGNQSCQSPKKPRMRDLLQDWGVDRYLQRVSGYLPQPLRQVTHCPMPLPTQPYGHLGIHPQRSLLGSVGRALSVSKTVAAGVSYMGMSLQLGQLTAAQLLGLVELSTTFGRGDLRLTPWQTVILPDIPNERVTEVVQTLASLGLSTRRDRPDAAIAACAGKPGCAASATETQPHAIALANHLNRQLKLECPVNIHLTGCEKSCAQPSPAEITLLGTTFEQSGEIVEGYHIYIGDDQESLKYHLGNAIAADIPSLMEQLLHLYQQHQKTHNESFREFASRQAILDLKALMTSSKLETSTVKLHD
ncbi:precorrin-3B synthase [Phormidium sp. CLA17]|uniref:precorrin-3B synthase n=1 Tax=Leptolyngbya sp. Cla-17 TaxID=2803751 RepID=UPI0018D6F550|nr:precorrin-3B synthase [Leptolyngbya sp. Cla-17]MBM0742587.1 precorrin-3B synthase [Leptolyngbya sp. Cla-17]